MSAKPKNYAAILLFGAPGAGKGTQGKILAQIPGLYHLSSGQVLRDISPNSDDGQQIIQFTSRGMLAPDDLTLRIIRRALKHLSEQGRYFPKEELLILDGVPRNEQQADMISEFVDVRHIIHLACVDESKMIARMKRRARIENRVDDADENIIRHRFEVYHEETAPILKYYSDDIITAINADGTPAEVLRLLLDVLIPLQNDHLVGNGIAEG